MSKTHKIKQAGYLAAGVLGVAGLCLASAPVERAQAACGGGTLVGDFYAPCDHGESEDGKISVQVVDLNDEKVLKVHLKNYSGGGIRSECCGSCEYWQDQAWTKMIVELTGENKITEPKGVGIQGRNLEFAGDGTLEIDAMIPLGGGTLIMPCMPHGEEEGPRYNLPNVDKESIQEVFGQHTVKIDLSRKNSASGDNNGSSQNPSTLPDGALVGPSAPCEQEAAKNDVALIWHIISGIYIGISLIAFLILAVKHFGKGKSQPGQKTSQNHQAPNSAAEESKTKTLGKDEDGE